MNSVYSGNPNLLVGLRGIMELFNVSKATAYKFKSTWLRPAIFQFGRVIITDKAKALELMAIYGQREVTKEN